MIAFVDTHSFNLILVGGGLANALITLRLKQLRPELRVLLIESGSEVGGNHIWSFHKTDLSSASLDWIKPLVAKSWPSYEVHFPRLSRVLEGGYFSVSSSDLHRALLKVAESSILLNQKAVAWTANEIFLQDGTSLKADCILDGTGFSDSIWKENGFQKFFGIHLTFKSSHGIKIPILMDARCSQIDGFHFLSILPWTETDLLVEDVYFSNSPDLNTARCLEQIELYCNENGWEILSRGKTERGVLPMPFYWDDKTSSGAISVGVRAGLFNPTTGYSFALAVRTAEIIANLKEISPFSVSEAIETEHETHFDQLDFFLFLNRMIFIAAAPNRRYKIFRRFFRLSEDLIQRFYNGKLSWADRFKLLSGKPVVPILKAVSCIWRSPNP